VAKNSTVRIRLSGSGGQGILLGGLILCEAAALYEGKHISQLREYGPETMGGDSRTDVIISDEEIDCPVVQHFDILVAMNQSSCDRHFYHLVEGGLLLADSELVTYIPTTEAVALPFTSTAREKYGRPLYANMIALGALAELSHVVSRTALEKAVRARVPKGTEETNLAALGEGFLLVERMRKSR